jgi:hypothetical protein
VDNHTSILLSQKYPQNPKKVLQWRGGQPVLVATQAVCRTASIQKVLPLPAVLPPYTLPLNPQDYITWGVSQGKGNAKANPKKARWIRPFGSCWLTKWSNCVEKRPMA